MIDLALLITIRGIFTAVFARSKSTLIHFITIHYKRSQSHPNWLTGCVPNWFLPLNRDSQRAQLHHRRDTPLSALQKLNHLLVLFADFSEHVAEFGQKFIFELEQLTCLVEEFKAVFEWIIQLV